MTDQKSTSSCTHCGRAIEECAWCNETDCAPATCESCLTEAMLKSIRPRFVHRGASISWEEFEPPVA